MDSVVALGNEVGLSDLNYYLNSSQVTRSLANFPMLVVCGTITGWLSHCVSELLPCQQLKHYQPSRASDIW